MNQMARFSTAARQVLATAQEHAQTLNDGTIRLHHVLLALLEQASDTVTARALAASSLTFDAAYDLIAKLPVIIPLDGQPQLSERVKAVVESAVRDAARPKNAPIEADHLLRGLLDVQDKNLFDLLSALGTTPEIVLTHLNRLTGEVGSFPTEAQTTAEAPVEQPPADILSVASSAASVASSAASVASSAAGTTDPENTPDDDAPSPLESFAQSLLTRSESRSPVSAGDDDSGYADRTIRLEITASGMIEPGNWIAQFPLHVLMEQYTRGEEGRIRLVMENLQIEISFE
ncbi:MAG: Clp protease N-terminal domain-containing protein [bacterium]|nr:Clp protease N-terminal domain-containing protein [bacterium]